MSKIAILSDIHANLPAFEAVLRDVQSSGAESIVFLGDTVGYGASPAKCVDLVRNLGGKCVMGNHDVEIGNVRRRGCTFRDPDWKQCGYQAGLAHAARCLDADQAAWLAALPYSMRIPGAIVAHGTLDEPEAFNYIDQEGYAEATLRILRRDKLKVGFVGHTHEQRVFAEDDTALEWIDEACVRIPAGMACVVNAGSVGQPRNEAEQRATWTLWDPAANMVEFRKVDYNRLKAAQDIAMAKLPLESALRLLTREEATFLLTP